MAVASSRSDVSNARLARSAPLAWGDAPEMKGQVFGLVVRSRGLGGNIMAGLRSLGGGEITEYTELLEDARRHAVDRMVKNATGYEVQRLKRSYGTSRATRVGRRPGQKSSPMAPPPSWNRSGARVLKRVIIGYGIVAVFGAVILAGLGVGSPDVLYLFVNGVIVIAALLFERGRYRPPMTPGGSWQETAERFVDPTTGQLMKVRYNPQTGARDYVPVKPPP